MSKKFQFNDDYYKKLVSDSNKLGNALLANLVRDKIKLKKRRITKINFGNEFVIYKNELEKLKSLKIGIIHNILRERNLDQLDRHFEVADILMNKINQILKEHVKHDAKEIISKEEFETLINSKASIEAISTNLKDVPDIAAESLQEIKAFQVHLHRILEIIDETTDFINDTQKVVLNSTSKIINCSR